MHTVYTTPHTEVAYVINGPHVALAVRVKKNLCELWFDHVRSKIGQVLLFICGTGRRSGGAVAAQWRRSGGAVAAQRRRSGGAVASFYYWSRGSPIQ